MDRRQFIQTTMAVAAAAAIPLAAHAMAAPEVPLEETAVPKANPYQRYVTGQIITFMDWQVFQ